MIALVTVHSPFALRFRADAQRARRMPEAHRVASPPPAARLTSVPGSPRPCRSRPPPCPSSRGAACPSTSRAPAGRRHPRSRACRSMRRNRPASRRTRSSACCRVAISSSVSIRPMRSAPCARIVSNFERLRIAVDRVLQLGARIADRFRFDEDRRNARVDHRRLQRADTRHREIVDEVAGREHRPARAFFLGGRVHEFELHFGRRERDAVQLEIAVSCTAPFVTGTCATIVLPMFACQIRTVATRRAARATDRPPLIANGPTAADRLPQLPVQSTNALSIDTEQVVDVVAGPRALRHDHRLAGGRRRAAHPVDLLAVRIGLPITRSSSASRAAPGACAASGRSCSRKNTPLLVPPRM